MWLQAGACGGGVGTRRGTGQHGGGTRGRVGGWLLPHGSFLHPAGAGQAGAGMEFLSSSESNAVIAFQAADANKDLINYIALVSQSAPDTSTWL